VNANRFVPLSGVIGVVLLIAGFGAAGNAPNAKASVAKITSFYGAHSTAQTVSGVLLSLGAILFLIFAVTVAGALGGGDLGALCVAGGVLVVAGLAAFAGLSITLGDVVDHVGDATIQTLNVLEQDAVFVFLITIGTCAFLLGAGIAVLRTRALPRWLGWMALVFALIAAIPSHVLGGTLDHIGFLGFIGLAVWTLIAGSILAAKG
jgi:hypothetical protein